MRNVNGIEPIALHSEGGYYYHLLHFLLKSISTQSAI